MDVSTMGVATLPERHTTFWPVVLLRHTMSALPSPSKSPRPEACHATAAAPRGDRGIGVRRFPDRILAGGDIAPEHIVTAIAIEISDADHAPRRVGHRC